MTSEADAFLASGDDEADEILGVSLMECEGQSFYCVMDDISMNYENALGGMESVVACSAVASASAVRKPLSMLRKRCKLDGIELRVAEVSLGKAYITFTLTHPSEAK